MRSRKLLGLAALLVFALAGCILIDSWFVEDEFIDPDGEGPEAPIPTFEIAAKHRQIEIDVDATAPILLCVETSTDSIDVLLIVDADDAPPCPRSVDPADWLGRLHFRSPT